MGRALKSGASNETVLVIEDDELVRSGITSPLRNRGFRVLEASSCASALTECSMRPALVISDLCLPDGNAIDLLPRLRSMCPDVPVLIVTGHGSIDLAVRAVKEGAEDFLTKPLDMSALCLMVDALLARRRVGSSGVRSLANGVAAPSSDAIRRVEEQVERLRDATCSVLLLGETGTGKSSLARRIHELGARSDGPLIDINCAGLTKDFVEAELFGHERGAYTGAHASKQGLLEIAHGGTLFLDEIGDLDIQVQPKLLKVLEEKRFRRMGDVKERSVDVRILGATHRDLLEASSRAQFRADLYYRISTLTITLPPLRERPEDIVPLARRMLCGFGLPELELSTRVCARLRAHAWPGNLRELRNVLERAILLSQGRELMEDHLRFDSGSSSRLAAPPASSRTLSQMEREHIWNALAAENGRVAAAAQRLGIPRSTLYQRIREHGLRTSELRRKDAPRDGNDIDHPED